jgi:nitroimidazol reductase NimA-like FMN-containing flavoprotein (pyridoxamine 5'-phosphate oxidase superfamily)
MPSSSRTARNEVRRIPKRASYELDTIHAILDEGLICHVGFAVEGKPFVIPMAYGRMGDRLLLHAAAASRIGRQLAAGIDVAVTVTLLDGLVLARSAFHHSMNYRSVVLFGRATLVEQREEKVAGLRALVEHLVPGRWEDVRQPNEGEIRGTLLLTLPIDEASAKIRTGPPADDEDDYNLAVWAGVVPLRLSPGSPVDDGRLAPGAPPAAAYRRPGDS